MVSLRRHARTLWIALAAIVGVVSAPGDAQARMAEGTAKGGADCCVSRPMTDCGCCVAEARPSRPAAPMRLAAPHATSPDAAGRHCECRADTPEAPASKPERMAGERRSSDQRAGLAHLHLIPARPATPVGPQVPPGDSSAEAPLYLLTLHFRC